MSRRYVCRMGGNAPVPLGARIVEAIADASDRDPLDLEPVYEAIDLAAWERLAANSETEWCVEFTVGRVDVRVDSDRTIDAHGR